DVVGGVHPGLADRAARPDQALPLVHPERLGMELQHLGDDPDHVERLGPVRHGRPFLPVARRATGGKRRPISWNTSWVRTSSPRGISTRTVTHRSPRPPPDSRGIPRPRTLIIWPLWVPGGTTRSTSPSTPCTLVRVPSTASTRPRETS